MLVVWGASLLQLLVTHRIRAEKSYSALVGRGAGSSWRSWKSCGGRRLLPVLEVRVVVENARLVRILVRKVVSTDVASGGSCRLYRRIPSVDMVVYRILNSTETEAAVQNRSAVLLVTLAEARVLVQLSQYLIESWHRMVSREVLQLLLYRLTRQLLTLLELVHQAVLVPIVEVRVGWLQKRQGW